MTARQSSTANPAAIFQLVASTTSVEGRLARSPSGASTGGSDPSST
jgi:hypothetical protein